LRIKTVEIAAQKNLMGLCKKPRPVIWWLTPLKRNYFAAEGGKININWRRKPLIFFVMRSV